MIYRIFFAVAATFFLMHHAYPASSEHEPISKEPSEVLTTEPLTTSHIVTLVYDHQSFNIPAETVINFAESLIKGKTSQKLNITPQLYKDIANDIGFLKTSLEKGVFNASTAVTVVQSLFDDVLKASPSNINKVFSKMGVPEEDVMLIQGAITAAATITQNSLQLAQGGKVTPASFFSCCIGTTLTIAQQLAMQQAEQSKK
ncbi:MAG: hypothetical protein KBD31_00735 [Proteobacteria bacterium]|nr:hypothetical protein [Pseudomonadota bacterium]